MSAIQNAYAQLIFVEFGVSVARRLLFGSEFPVGIGNCHFYHFVVVALFAHALFGEIFGVAAEQNVSH